MHARRAVRPTATRVHLTDLFGERFVALLAPRQRPLLPRVEAAARNPEQAAHACDAKRSSVGFDEAEFQLLSSAKNTNAFFRISRCSVTSRSSLRSRRISSDSTPIA